MSPAKQRFIDAFAVAITAALFFFSAGCTRPGAKTYPVKGQLEVTGGDLKALAGHTVEVALVSDPQVRAAGQIQDDGSFTLETLQQGAILNGAAEGTYKARIVLADDDIAARNLAAKSLHPRYLQFDKSGLSLEVPAAQVVSLKVTRR
jgi:hypothetical protein